MLRREGLPRRRDTQPACDPANQQDLLPKSCPDTVPLAERRFRRDSERQSLQSCLRRIGQEMQDGSRGNHFKDDFYIHRDACWIMGRKRMYHVPHKEQLSNSWQVANRSSLQNGDALQMACAGGYEKVVQMLTNSCANDNTQGSSNVRPSVKDYSSQALSSPGHYCAMPSPAVWTMITIESCPVRIKGGQLRRWGRE